MHERRTKIIATVGPASWDDEVLAALIEAGADVLRLNFSHADRERHARTVASIRAAAERAGREVAVLGDLPGPKLRIGELRDDVAELETGMHVQLTPRQVEGDRETIPVDWPGVGSLRADELVYLADGSIRLRVREPEDGGVGCEVEVGGTLSSHKGMNVPGVAARATSDGDLGWVEFAVEQGLDLIAVSFVSSAADLEPVAERLRALDSDIPLIAKIEKPGAAENAEEIVRAASGGIMVARGDLGIELPLAEVPVVQKRLIRTAGQRSKPAITATQMLASMVSERRPTRAEVTDVANAIFDGSDAVMLSEETAVGRHPVEAVRTMDGIAGRGRRRLPAQPGGDGRADHERPQRPARLRPPAERAGAGDLAADRDGAPPQPPVRRHRGPQRAGHRGPRPARRLRRARRPPRRRRVRRADRDRRRRARPGAGDEPLRGPQRALSGPGHLAAAAISAHSPASPIASIDSERRNRSSPG